MLYASFIPFVIGFLAVIQTGLNRRIAATWDLSSAGLVTGAVTTLAALGMLVLSRAAPDLVPALFRPKAHPSPFFWWHLVPGLCGFCFVVGIPLAISRFGAVQVFLGLIASQIIGSLAWDALIEHKSLTAMRLVGALITAVGATLVSLSK